MKMIPSHRTFLILGCKSVQDNATTICLQLMENIEMRRDCYEINRKQPSDCRYNGQREKRIETFAVNGGHVDQNDQRVENIDAHIEYFSKTAW